MISAASWLINHSNDTIELPALFFDTPTIMRVNTVTSVICLALAATAAASAIAATQHVDDNVDTDLTTIDPGPASNATHELDPWNYPNYDCRGSVMCGSTPVRVCDIAVNQKLIRADDVYYGPGLAKVGACNGLTVDLGCGIFVQGNSDCVRTGEEIWDDYQDIRYIAGCPKCGTKHWAPGCMTTINYITWCNSQSVEH